MTKNTQRVSCSDQGPHVATEQRGNRVHVSPAGLVSSTLVCLETLVLTGKCLVRSSLFTPKVELLSHVVGKHGRPDVDPDLDLDFGI